MQGHLSPYKLIGDVVDSMRPWDILSIQSKQDFNFGSLQMPLKFYSFCNTYVY